MMELLVKFTVFSLFSVYFFLLGWNFYLLCKLWGTVEYGGKAYKGALFKILASTVLLYLAFLLVNLYKVPKDAEDIYVLFSAPFVLLGWFIRLWRYRKKN